MDVAAMNVMLDCLLGPGAGSAAPAYHELALFTDDPDAVDDWSALEVSAMNDDAEATGYARVRIDPGDWLPANDGEKETAATVSFPDPTAEWDDVVTHVGLVGADGSLYVAWPLPDAIVVGGAGTWGAPVVALVRFADSLDPEGDEE